MEFFKNILLLLLCYFLTGCAFKFSGDRKYKLYQTYIIDSLRIPRSKFDSIKFEARVWVNVDYNLHKTLLIISYRKYSSDWFLSKYEIDGDRMRLLEYRNLSASVEWSSKWDSLVKHRFLKLPTDSYVQKKWKSSTGKKTVNIGGVYYVVDLLRKNKIRGYAYTNPEKKLAYYQTGIEELIDFNKCLEILNNEFYFRK